MYIKKRGSTKSSALKVYKRSPKAQTKGEGIETKNITCPYLEPNQSKKLTREEGLKTIDILTQDQRLHTKEFFNLWSESSSLPKANIFLFFQTNQNIHKETICQAFLRAFPHKHPMPPKKSFLH